jgi:hypothetical protein
VKLRQSIAEEMQRLAEERLRVRRDDPKPFLRRDRKNAAGGTGGGKGRTHDAKGAKGPGTGGTTSPGSTGDGGVRWEWMPPGSGRGGAAGSMWAASTADDPVITVERTDRPGRPPRPPAPPGITRGVQGLPRAPYRPAGARPGTTRTRTEAPMSASPVRLPGRAPVAAEHLTEVTLDDVLDHLAKSRRRTLATYDECAVLADRARQLQRQLAALADELATHHNVIGRLTSRAMARLSEAMDLLARQADAMRRESLTATEALELAHDQMHDAYRPVQTAAADAGLRMPSARIHNQED